MARPLRVEFPNVVYHITSRGNDGGNIFLEDGDGVRFFKILKDYYDEKGGYLFMPAIYGAQ